MAKRFSGEVRVTVTPAGGDTYSYSLKLPGIANVVGEVTLESGYTDLHGADEAADEAARKALERVEEVSGGITDKASMSMGTFHVGRTKADKWVGGPSNRLTKRGR